jgi:hypothetical protein
MIANRWQHPEAAAMQVVRIAPLMRLRTLERLTDEDNPPLLG